MASHLRPGLFLSPRLASLYVFFASFAAWACPVCGAAQDTKGTYINMTLVMSGLPLVTIGSIVLGVALRFKRAEEEEKKLASVQK